MVASAVSLDKYRSYMSEEELKTTNWRFGPPNYDAVNKLFEEDRTKIWPVGSLGEKVQNLVKTFDMELIHKVNQDDYKTLDPKKFVLGVNGKRFYNLEELREAGGSYNVYLQTSLPPSLRLYDPDQETCMSALTTFATIFPRGFAIEILEVYSGPPVITYKLRHWSYMDGPFKWHAPTGELIEFFGIGILTLDENSKIVKLEFFWDRGELLSSLIKGKISGESTCDVS